MQIKLKVKNLLRSIVLGLPLLVIVGCVLWIIIERQNSVASTNYFKVQGSMVHFLQDPTCSMQMEEVVQLPDSVFKTMNGSGINFGFNPSDVWLKFELSSQLIKGEQYLFEIKNPLLNKIELYERVGAEIRMVHATGDTHLFSTRGYDHKNFIFPLRFEGSESRVYYLSVNGGGEQLLVPMTLWSPESLAIRDAEDSLVRGSYFGIILFVLLFNLFIYFIIRERSTLYYVYYNFFLLLLQLSLGGYGFKYLWPGSPYFTNASTPLFASLGVFALMRFSQYFLEIHRFYPKINKTFSILGYSLLVNALFSLSGISVLTQFSILFVNVLALLLNLAIIPTAIAVYRNRFKPAKYFLIGFIILVIAVFGFVLTNLGVIQSDFYADYGLLIGSTAEVILLSLAIVDRFKQFKDQALQSLQDLNQLQREQNVVLEKKVAERTIEIEQKSAEVQLKNEEILSSIRYAERIQQNALPSESVMDSVFQEYFVLYQPKDIVSGDFYWVGKSKLNGVVGPAHDVVLMATGDCTGHGVPGAMVSVLGCNLLRETVLQNPELPPNQLLENLDERLQQAIGGTQNNAAGDGMDISLWALQLDNKKLSYSGANTGVSIWRSGVWIDLPATRRPIGMRGSFAQNPFQLNSVDLQTGDIIYSWTDGAPDQFGGPSGKKLKTKAFKEFLASIAGLSLKEQQQRLSDFLESWRGSTEQTDDICITAVRVF